MRALNLRACMTARLVSSRAGDPSREAEVVLDPPRRAGLSAERGPLDTSVSRPSEAPYTAAPSPAGPPPTTSRSTSSRAASSRPIPSARETSPVDGPCSSAPPGSRTSGRLAASSPRRARPRRRPRVGIAPREGQQVVARELDRPQRRGRRARPDDLEADAFGPLQRLAPRDEGREQEVAERPVLEQQRPQASRSTAM